MTTDNPEDEIVEVSRMLRGILDRADELGVEILVDGTELEFCDIAYIMNPKVDDVTKRVKK